MYEIFVQLCKERGVSPYQVSKETGIAQSTLTNWKNNTYRIRENTLEKLANYFGVSLAYLKGEPADPSAAPDTASVPDSEPTAAELVEYLEMLRSRSECRMLFSLAKDATAEDVQRAVAVIEALRHVEGRD